MASSAYSGLSIANKINALNQKLKFLQWILNFQRSQPAVAISVSSGPHIAVLKMKVR